jgi:hypothetical protein
VGAVATKVDQRRATRDLAGEPHGSPIAEIRGANRHGDAADHDPEAIVMACQASATGPSWIAGPMAIVMATTSMLPSRGHSARARCTLRAGLRRASGRISDPARTHVPAHRAGGAEVLSHGHDLALLRGDDVLRERLEGGILALGKLGLGHDHGALVVGDHHRDVRLQVVLGS